LEGLYPGVELYFSQGSDGIHIHSAGTAINVYPSLVGKGGDCTLTNLTVVGTKAEGTRGVIIQRSSVLQSVVANNWGWHGHHITADVHRTATDIDGGNSNANRTHLDRCSAGSCGSKPGYDARLISATNPLGHREWGCGLRINGGDTNICTTESFHAVGCSGWAIDDGGFLGNIHTMPDQDLCGHVVEDWEATTDTYGVPVGSKLNLAYRQSNANGRGLLVEPYVEQATPTSIIDVRPPSFVVGGIGGADQATTRRIKAGELTGSWIAKTADNTGSVTLAEGNGYLLSLSSGGDGPVRLKYGGGFWRLDHRNLSARVYAQFTGDSSLEGTRALLPGYMVLPRHYVQATTALIREQIYAKYNTLTTIETAYPAAGKQVGDAYTCLSPVVGGIHTAVVVAVAGVNKWAATAVVQAPA
jgi:hypothetical protein